MGSRIATAIGELGAEVKKITRKRRRRSALPEGDAIGRFIALTFSAEQAAELRQHEAVIAAVAALPVPDEARVLRGAVCDALAEVVRGDARAYERALGEVERSLVAFCLAGETGWWSGGVVSTGGPAEVEMARSLTALDLGGYLLRVADRFVPRAKPPAITRKAPERLEKPAHACAGLAPRTPDRIRKPLSAVGGLARGVGEKVVAAVESLGAKLAGPEVEVIVLRRLPGDPPVMPEGSKTFGGVEDWNPYERYER